jgi:hypothetical protein
MSCPPPSPTYPYLRADDWAAAQDRGSDHRGEIAIPDANGIIPLHIAVWHKAPRSFIDFLVSSYPDGASVKTNGGYYPIDYAKLFYKEDETLEVLLEVKEVEVGKEKEIEVEGSQTQLHKVREEGGNGNASVVGGSERIPRKVADKQREIFAPPDSHSYASGSSTMPQPESLMRLRRFPTKMPTATSPSTSLSSTRHR